MVPDIRCAPTEVHGVRPGRCGGIRRGRGKLLTRLSTRFCCAASRRISNRSCGGPAGRGQTASESANRLQVRPPSPGTSSVWRNPATTGLAGRVLPAQLSTGTVAQPGNRGCQKAVGSTATARYQHPGTCACHRPSCVTTHPHAVSNRAVCHPGPATRPSIPAAPPLRPPPGREGGDHRPSHRATSARHRTIFRYTSLCIGWSLGRVWCQHPDSLESDHPAASPCFNGNERSRVCSIPLFPFPVGRSIERW
jgi:hypothetical protein